MVQAQPLFDRDNYLFALLLALLATLLGYQFGAGNQVEQLPIILRQLNADYLINDVFVNSSVAFGPRLYFAQFIALCTQLLPLHWVYLILAYLSDLALVLVSMWAARSIFDADKLAAAIAAILALGVTSFHLGEATQIRYEIFQPANLAIPAALWAVGLGLQGRAVTAAIVASFASLPHPLYGAEGGAVALGTAFFVRLIPADVAINWSRQNAASLKARLMQLAWRDAIKSTAVGGVIFAFLLAAFWWWPNKDVNTGANLTTAEMFAILAHYRAPHHYLPSHFPLQDFVTASLFVVISGFTYQHWSQSVSQRRALLLLLPVLAVALACVLGVLFIEIWPSSLILTLQPFRLLSIFKWLGFILLAILLAQYWLKPPTKDARLLVGLSLLSGGVTHTLVNFAALCQMKLMPWKWTFLSERVWTVALMLGAFALWAVFGSLRESVYLVLAVALLSSFFYRRRENLLVFAAVIILTVAVIGFIKPGTLLPVFTLAAHDTVQSQTARAAAANTPEDSVFIAPPQFSILRIIGQRALVVDFKSIPFQHQAMRDWRERMRDVYGDVDVGGFYAARAFDKKYRTISDEKLLFLAKKYSARYAILYTDSATNFEVLYNNSIYKIIELPN